MIYKVDYSTETINEFKKVLSRNDYSSKNSQSIDEIYERAKNIATKEDIAQAIIFGPLNMFPKLLEFPAITEAQENYIKGFIERNNISQWDFIPKVEYPVIKDLFIMVDFNNKEELALQYSQMVDRILLLDYFSELFKNDKNVKIVEFQTEARTRGAIWRIVDPDNKDISDKELRNYYCAALYFKETTDDQKTFIKEYFEILDKTSEIQSNQTGIQRKKKVV